MKISNIVKSFIALGHDTRLTIYNLLIIKGEKGIPAGEVAAELDIPGATLSFHLTSLTEAKLIGSRREGRTIYYYVKYKRVKNLIKYLKDPVAAIAAEADTINETEAK
ncbi:MAG: metalloregulator ArsR/SmtB family transcription factor [Alphaproteobacteria bacterium]|nr:metalloregulator ArsR/SmtB family transcription factor [Alphaproteobacteria bacterium]